MMLQVKDVYKSFNQTEILKGVSFALPKQKVLALIGASGSGKSTLLRCINRLETIDEGHIYFNQQDIMAIKNINHYRSQVGMVFQSFNLFNNLNVLDNCTLAPMLVNHKTKQEVQVKAYELLEKVGMASFAQASIQTLSGGQKQRVAIARALAMEPQLLLFDEPTSALDPQMVDEVLKVIKQLAKEGLSMIIVTHEMEFAFEVADEIIFMHQGKIVEQAKPHELLAHPQKEETRQFLKRYLKKTLDE